MSINKLLLAALLATAFAPALAEEGAEPQPQPRVFDRRVVLAGGEHPVMAGEGMVNFRFSSKVVKNAPYSAEVVSERVQSLADGNQITRSTTSLSYRDSAGRTRHEVRDNNGEVRVITIQDPVEKVTYVLHPKDKTATRIARGARFEALSGPARAAAESARAAAEGARAQAEQLRKEGKLQMVERRKTADGEEIVIRRLHRAAEAPGVAREARAQIGPVLANAFGDAQWAAKAVTKDLGTREFDGIKAQGKQRSYEIPAGAIGNRNAIVVSDESWTSPELQVTVYTKHSDPRSGDAVYRLHNLKREEPAAALFSVPSDYTVKDVLANIKRKSEEKAQ